MREGRGTMSPSHVFLADWSQRRDQARSTGHRRSGMTHSPAHSLVTEVQLHVRQKVGRYPGADGPSKRYL